MKKYIFFIAIAGLVALAACGGKQINPKKKLKSSVDSFSYTLGYEIGKYVKGNGIDEIDYSSLLKGVEEAMKKDSGFSIANKDLQRVHTLFLNREKMIKSKKLKAEAEKWFAENAKQKDVKPLSAKGQYKLIKAGSGSVPGEFDTVFCNLVITSQKGKELVNTAKGSPEPFKITMDKIAMLLNPAVKEAFEKSTAGSEFEVYTLSDETSGLARVATNADELNGVMKIRVQLLQVKAGKKPEDKPAAKP
jgi:FKBP-type peptidyl-prolyl cis-trans isomerase